MGTQLIMTVGTNALPVWVAWYHLTRNLSQPVSVQFVYTEDAADAPGTKAEKDLLESYCLASSVSVLTAIPVDANRPDINGIRDRIIRARPDGCQDDLHVHYTGGTQAMGVATVAAMAMTRANIGTVNTDASYLDPGRGSAPNIVSWDTSILIPDTRVNVDAAAFGSSTHVTTETDGQVFAGSDAVIRKVAELNGFEVGRFNPGNPWTDPKIPTDNELHAGTKVLEYVGEFDYYDADNRLRNSFTMDLLNRNPRGWNRIFSNRNGNFNYPTNGGTFQVPACHLHWNNSIWCDEILPALEEAYPIGWDRTTGSLTYPNRTAATASQKNAIEKTHDFLNGHWLEYAAYTAFNNVLQTINRDNYELWHSVYVRIPPRNQQDAPIPFELDVVAVLGYQVIVVSCSVTSGRKDIKLKAVEAYHRAKQLGGDEARAVVICVATDPAVQSIQRELADETGTKQPLRIWGRTGAGNMPNLQSLEDKFTNLLNDLYWN